MSGDYIKIVIPDSPLRSPLRGDGAKNSPLIFTSQGMLTRKRSPTLLHKVALDPTSPAHAPQLFATVTVVCSWFICNIGMLLVNKYFLANYGFKRPVFLTFCHMTVCSALSILVRASGFLPRQSLKSMQQFGKIGMLAVVFCFSVVCGNTALRYIPASFAQAISATTPFFTAVEAFLLVGQRESKNVYASLLPVVGGVILTSHAEPLFHMGGFAAALGAAALRGLKSVMQGALLTDPNEKLDGINLLHYMSPVAALILLPAIAVLEPNVFVEALEAGSRDTEFWLLLLSSSLVSYFLNLTNFLVTRFTSPLTLQVLGNLKAVAAVVVSVLVFQNPVPLSSGLGFAITSVGVALYSMAKLSQRSNRKD